MPSPNVVAALIHGFEFTERYAALIALFFMLAVGQCLTIPVAAQAQQLDIGIEPINFHVYVLKQTNEYRAANGQAKIPFTPYRLHQAAQKYAEYLARTNTTGHTADGRNVAERLRAEGYQPCYSAENVYEQWNSAPASWQNAADGAMNFWRNSPEHAANMRDPRAKQLGVGVAAWKHGDRNYYKVVQVFGDNCAPPPNPRKPLGKQTQ